MRFGKVKAHAGQACRVSKLNTLLFLVLGKPAFSLLLLWAAFWSIHRRKVERVNTGHTLGVYDLRNSERDQG